MNSVIIHIRTRVIIAHRYSTRKPLALRVGGNTPGAPESLFIYLFDKNVVGQSRMRVQGACLRTILSNVDLIAIRSIVGWQYARLVRNKAIGTAHV